MSGISGIGGGEGGGIGMGDSNRFAEMSSEEFFNIMFTELTQQDPLDPQDSQAILDQISAIRDIEANTNLMSQLEEVVGQNQFASAAGLVGKHIGGIDEGSNQVSGRVVSAGIEGDAIMLTLEDGSRVNFDNVQEVFDLTMSG
ncbi:MAG: flagellar hook capping FlgD N-terminal domain-containing protein [Planctomycetota bacterium]